MTNYAAAKEQKHTIRLATASPATRATTRETLAQLRRLAQRAAGAAPAADVLLLPEAYLGGYPRGADFGCKVGARSAEGRDAFLRYFRGAVDLGDAVGDGGAGAGEPWVRRRLPPASSVLGRRQSVGDGGGGKVGGEGGVGVGVERGDGTREEIESIARETGVFLVVGLIEKAGGSLYCAVGYVCPKLGFIGKRRKVLPTGSERLIWAQGSPSTLKAVSTTIRGVRVNLAAAICWENYMPLLRQALYAQNVNLWLAPTADGRDAWVALMRTVALEGRCFVVSSNMCVRGGRRRGGGGGGEGQRKGKGKGKGGKEEEKEEKKEGEALVFDDDAVDGGAAIPPYGSRRRNSCLTEEGFEIALPTPATTATATTTTEKTGTSERVIPVSATAAVGDTEEEEEEEEEEEQEFISRGGSAIIGPDGEVLAGPQWEDDEGIIYADVDFEDCIRGRLDLDAAGSYSRNDSFKFSVEGLDLDPLPY